jgi:hypothetical protein
MDGREFNAAVNEASVIANMLSDPRQAHQGIERLSQEFSQHSNDPSFGAVVADQVRAIQDQQVQLAQQRRAPFPAAKLNETPTNQVDQYRRQLEDVTVSFRDQSGRPCTEQIGYVPMGLANQEYARFRAAVPQNPQGYYAERPAAGYGAPAQPGLTNGEVAADAFLGTTGALLLNRLLSPRRERR